MQSHKRPKACHRATVPPRHKAKKHNYMKINKIYINKIIIEGVVFFVLLWHAVARFFCCGTCGTLNMVRATGFFFVVVCNMFVFNVLKISVARWHGGTQNDRVNDQFCENCQILTLVNN